MTPPLSQTDRENLPMDVRLLYEVIERRETGGMILQARECELLNRLIAEWWRAREAVEKLPKTADGVPIVPGMTVYCREFNDDTLKPTGRILAMTVRSFAQDEQIRDGSLWWALLIDEHGGRHQVSSDSCFAAFAASAPTAAPAMPPTPGAPGTPPPAAAPDRSPASPPR